MRSLFIILTIVTFFSDLWAIDVSSDTKTIDVLSQSQIYIDDTSALSLEEIKGLDTEFSDNNVSRFNYSYSPKFTVWLRFDLRNDSSQTIEKILKYDHPVTTGVTLFQGSDSWKEGLYDVPEDRVTTSPIFKIILPPNSSQTYYLKANSYIMPLIIGLKLYDTEVYYRAELKHQVFLALFFGGMGILFLYNLSIYFFTRDRSYLYYVIYVFFVTLHQAHVTGTFFIVFPQSFITAVGINAVMSIIAAFVLAFVIFIKSFINTAQYPRLNGIYNALLYLFPPMLLLSLTGSYIGFVIGYFQSVIIYAVVISLYAAFQRNRQAYFIVIGWLIVAVIFTLMLLANLDIYDVFIPLPYIVEVGLLLEALIFSIALADRINQLQEQRNTLNIQLISQQKSEEMRLKELVYLRTGELSMALDEKELLFRELHHRVKNNMQIIISLLRLQNHTVVDEPSHRLLEAAQNRIKAMSHLHELLYTQENVTEINTFEYFDRVVSDLANSLDIDKEKITMTLNINTDLPMSEAIYCGIILNELVSNAYKYAFDGKGNIEVRLDKDKDQYLFIITDDGNGYVPSDSRDTLGLKIVEILVIKQLKGTLDTDTLHGTSNTITWKDDA